MKLIINIDGGARGNPGPAASGVIIKSAGGKFLFGEGYFLGEQTNNHAEFSALKFALDAAEKLKGGELDIYSDSELLVKQYNGIYKIKNENLKVLMGEIKTAAGNFKKVRLTHVLREKNKEADAIANKAMDAAAKSKNRTQPMKVRISSLEDLKKKPFDPKKDKHPVINEHPASCPGGDRSQDKDTSKSKKDKYEQLELFG
ncbi:ribonuclease HI [Parelusimicrobium proximum]|uniref:ribonuclease HI family protein n=1 Tax=Parelusimicrobium proximum TaxID=3228953 RepID=UPI003D186718